MRSAVAARLRWGCSANDTARLACVALRSAQDRPSIGADGVKTYRPGLVDIPARRRPVWASPVPCGTYGSNHPACTLRGGCCETASHGGKFFGTHSPRRAGAANPTQGVDHHAHSGWRLGRLGRDHWQRRRANGPCVICHFRGIRSGVSHSDVLTQADGIDD